MTMLPRRMAYQGEIVDAFRHHHARQHDIDGEDMAVASDATQLQAQPHRARMGTKRELVVFDAVFGVQVPRFRWQQHFHLASDQLRPKVTEKQFRPFVDHDDGAGEVDHDQGIRQCLDDRGREGERRDTLPLSGGFLLIQLDEPFYCTNQSVGFLIHESNRSSEASQT